MYLLNFKYSSNQFCVFLLLLVTKYPVSGNWIYMKTQYMQLYKIWATEVHNKKSHKIIIRTEELLRFTFIIGKDWRSLIYNTASNFALQSPHSKSGETTSARYVIPTRGGPSLLHLPVFKVQSSLQFSRSRVALKTESPSNCVLFHLPMIYLITELSRPSVVPQKLSFVAASRCGPEHLDPVGSPPSGVHHRSGT